PAQDLDEVGGAGRREPELAEADADGNITARARGRARGAQVVHAQAEREVLDARNEVRGNGSRVDADQPDRVGSGEPDDVGAQAAEGQPRERVGARAGYWRWSGHPLQTGPAA